MTDKSWISVHNSMPALNRLVEIKDMDDGQKFAEFKVSRFKLSREDFNILYFLVDEDTLTDFSRVTHWRYPVEKKPDFGKLNNGDIVILKLTNDKYSTKIGYVYSISEMGICITNYKNIGNGNITHFFENIKKITRINLEKQTFEEI